MTDFRVELPDEVWRYTIGEPGWHDADRLWTPAEKEHGDVRWTHHLHPAEVDLHSLLALFAAARPLKPDTLKLAAQRGAR